MNKFDFYYSMELLKFVKLIITNGSKNAAAECHRPENNYIEISEYQYHYEKKILVLVTITN